MKLSLRSLKAIALVTLVGCSASSSGNAPAQALPDGSSNATPSPGPSCSGESDNAALHVKRSPLAISPPRDHHGTMISESGDRAYLYVIGGAQDEFATVHADVQRTLIAADGSLGPFETISQIPRGRAGYGLGRLGNTVVLAGGVVGQPKVNFTKETLTAKIGDDGTLGPWITGPDLPVAVMHPATVVEGEWFYVFGGTIGTSPSKMLVRAKLNADGTLGPYESLTPLSPARSHQAAFTYEHAIYLVGGLTSSPMGNPPSQKDVVRADIQADGTIGPWTGTGELPVPLSVSSAQRHSCSIYIFGGYTDSTTSEPFTDTILRAPLGGETSFSGATVDAAKLSIKRGHVHQTPMYKNFIYSVGGRDADRKSLGVIDIGVFE